MKRNGTRDLPVLALAVLTGALAGLCGCADEAARAERVERELARSAEALRARDYAAAAEAAARATEEDPRHVEAWLALGLAESRRQGWAAAITAYRRAIELDPYQEKALNNLANVYFRQGRYDEASTWYGRALEVDPDYLLAAFHYGWTLRQLNRLEEADRVFERCKEIPATNDRERQTHLDCHFYLGSIRFRQGDYRAAAAIMEDVLAVIPGHSEARYLLGLSYRKMGRMDDASRQLEIHRQMLQAMRAKPIPEPVDR